MTQELTDLYKSIVGYLIPALLSACVYVLWNINEEIRHMGQTMAVAVSRVETHERSIQTHDGRIENHEIRLLRLEEFEALKHGK